MLVITRHHRGCINRMLIVGACIFNSYNGVFIDYIHAQLSLLKNSIRNRWQRKWKKLLGAPYCYFKTDQDRISVLSRLCNEYVAWEVTCQNF